MRAILSRLFLLFLILCSGEALGREAYWEEHRIDLSGLTEQQVLFLESTITELKTLQPGDLKINKKTYRRLSRFKELFGISFNGNDLSSWLLSRIEAISYHPIREAALNQNKGTLILGDLFFARINLLERLYLLIHEARHSDGDGYEHRRCPKGFQFISASEGGVDLEESAACDDRRDGAYAFQAAFLFELFAYGMFDQREVGLLYNSSISRVIIEKQR